MQEEKIYLTKEGFKQYEERLAYLQEVARPQVIEEIKEARNQGDLSENAEYDAARDKQAAIEAEILEIQHILENCIVIESSASAAHSTVRIGSTVKFYNLLTKNIDEVTIVGALDADPFNNKISNSSALAKALMGKKTGEEVEVEAPKKYKVRVETIL